MKIILISFLLVAAALSANAGSGTCAAGDKNQVKCEASAKSCDASEKKSCDAKEKAGKTSCGDRKACSADEKKSCDKKETATVEDSGKSDEVEKTTASKGKTELAKPKMSCCSKDA